MMWASRRTLAFVAAFLLATGTAFADTGDSELISFTFIAPIINSVFGQNIIFTFMAAGLSIAGRVNSLAMNIAGGLALIALLWSITMAMLNKDSPLVAAIEPIIFAILTLLLLRNYVTVVHDVVNLGQQVITLTGSSVGEAVQSFANTFLRAFARMWVNASQRTTGINILAHSFDLFAAVVLLAIAAIMILIALKDVVGVFLIGPLALGLGVALGPLFVATIPSSYTRNWFNHWFNFLINAAMMTAISVVVMLLVNQFISQTITQITASPDGSLGKLIALALIAASMSKVFTAIPDFADGLMPGRTNAGKAISDAPGKGMVLAAAGLGKVGVKAASLVTQGVAGGISKVGQAAAAGAKAGAGGAGAAAINKAAQATGGGGGGGGGRPGAFQGRNGRSGIGSKVKPNGN